jgi:hypothetical protein
VAERRRLKRKQGRARMAKLEDAADLKSDDGCPVIAINIIKTIRY